jgi:hypothetical protein
LANVRRWLRIVAIDVCWFFNFVVVFSLIGDSTVISMIIGEAHRTVRSVSSFYYFFFGPPIGALLIMDQGYIGSPFLLAQGASDRQYYWRRAGGIGSPILFVQGASVRQYYWRREHPIANSISGGGIGALIIFKLYFPDFFHVQSAITTGVGSIGAPLVLAKYK